MQVCADTRSGNFGLCGEIKDFIVESPENAQLHLPTFLSNSALRGSTE